MVMNVARAVAWGLTWMLRVPRSEPVAHRGVEHAHWERAQRRWVVHQEEPEPTVSRAA
jgi:hypothetical protein